MSAGPNMRVGVPALFKPVSAAMLMQAISELVNTDITSPLDATTTPRAVLSAPH
ncbi:hypothetical protein J2W27_000727 [Variovorax boronicumulans]|nr:hypothetical protein [Variovorax boronicumulans]